MEKRTLTSADIDKVRNIDGFPIGTDADIIALSNAPFSTACPNPFIADYIKEYGTQYDEETDAYHCEPFASDVSEGKKDPIYNAHSYHTKVPYKAIMRYILHYTKPGDIVLDGFCGTGMTGVAAQMCGSTDEALKQEMLAGEKDILWGSRRAIISDLAPAAMFISSLYNQKVDPDKFEKLFSTVISATKAECEWMYKVHPNPDDQGIIDDKSRDLLYTVYSDVFICPNCGEEIVFWDSAIDKETGSVKSTFKCTSCGAELKKASCKRAVISMYDETLAEVVSIGKQIPVLICYEGLNGNEYIRTPDDEDLELLNRIENTSLKYWVPKVKTPEGFNTEQPRRSHGVNYVHQFFYKRSLIALSTLWHNVDILDEPESMKTALKSTVTGIMLGVSKLQRYRMNSTFPNMILSGTLYIGSTVREWNVLNWVQGKYKSIKRLKDKTQFFNDNDVIISNNSLTQMPCPDNSVDYIFTDPPFGGNLNYSELSCIWEAWLKVYTNNGQEAIMNDVQHKGLLEYQALMTQCLSECYRVLKPNHWITIEFHNSKNSVWNAIQESLMMAGFIISDIRTLDKKQQSFKQINFTSSVQQDLVISAYKPANSFTQDFKLKAGTEKTVWSFVRQHLGNVPVTVKRGGQLEVIAERQAFLLWDRMVAYHIMHGIAVPMDAADFYRGLDEKYGATKRDGMYFLPSQVNQYDKVRATCEVENIQFSLFVSDEKTAIGWLYQQLDAVHGEGPQTYADLMPKFMQELKAVDKREKMPELMVILEENFLKDKDGKWYIPDYTKSGDIAKLREKNLWKEFQEYQQSKGKLKQFRSEAIRVGFARLWKEKDYAAIVAMAERLPEETIQEDQNLLMYYDISLSRV